MGPISRCILGQVKAQQSATKTHRETKNLNTIQREPINHKPRIRREEKKDGEEHAYSVYVEEDGLAKKGLEDESL